MTSKQDNWGRWLWVPAFAGTTAVEADTLLAIFASGLKPAEGIFQHGYFQNSCLAGGSQTSLYGDDIR
jgi:hypothetical protein